MRIFYLKYAYLNVRKMYFFFLNIPTYFFLDLRWLLFLILPRMYVFCKYAYCLRCLLLIFCMYVIFEFVYLPDGYFYMYVFCTYFSKNVPFLDLNLPRIFTYFIIFCKFSSCHPVWSVFKCVPIFIIMKKKTWCLLIFCRDVLVKTGYGFVEYDDYRLNS